MSGISRVAARVATAGARLAELAQRVVPDPWVIALMLGLVVVGAGMLTGTLTGRIAPIDIVQRFVFGFLKPDLLAFAFQMALVLLTGNAVAAARPVRRALDALADRPTTAPGAVLLVAVTAMGLSLLNWGLGLVGGAVCARSVGRNLRRRGIPCAYGVIGAAGYAGIAVWHGGLSGSAPLKVAVDGAYGPAIPVSQTLFAPLNLVCTGAVFVVFSAAFWALGHRDDDGLAPPDEAPPGAPPATTSGGLEDAPVLTGALALLCLTALGAVVVARGAAAITLDWMILLFFAVGLVLHRGPAAYANAFAEGAREASGVLLQFPLYFGIVAVTESSGLVDIVADAGAEGASLLTFLGDDAAASLSTFWSACALNLLIPSGGGQWVVQAPLVLRAAEHFGADRADLVMAFAYGDETTNLLQPFWALPVLSITGLRARDILGYTTLLMLVEIALISALLIVFARIAE